MSDNPKNRTLYLHIGMHKTGTTALQKFFSINDKVLGRHGICYPATGRVGAGIAHHDIANSLKGPPFPLRAPERSVDEYMAQLRDDFSSFPRVLLSSEIFMRFLPAFRDRLPLNLSCLDRLVSTADAVRVIIYLRRQDEYLESFYAQEIQHDLTMSFPDFVAARMPDYFQLCHELAGFFGKRSVSVRVYDRELFTGGSIFSDFLSVAGIELADEFVIPGQDVNPSLTPDEREFKRLVNALGLTLEQLLQFNGPLMELSEMRRGKAGAGDSPEALFSPAQRQALLGACSSVNRRVAAEFAGGGQADGELFSGLPDGVSPRPGVYPGPARETLVEITDYLSSHSPELMALLSIRVEKGLRSDDRSARESARRLEAVI